MYFLWNPSEYRLRAGWRIALFVAMLVVISVVLQETLKACVPAWKEMPIFSQMGPLIVVAASATLSTILARKWLDKRDLKSMGLSWTADSFKDLVFGYFLSAAMAVCFFVLVFSTGHIRYEGIAWGAPGLGGIMAMSAAVLVAFFIIHVLVGWWEELVFRGYLFANIRDGLGLGWAIVVTSAIFSGLHLLNPNGGGILSTLIIVLFALQAVFALLLTGRLWMAIGMHMGWNFFQGPIFGFAASGNQTPGVIRQSPIGPDWLSGGSFGPEGSVLIVPILLVSLVIIRWRARRQRNSFAFVNPKRL